MKKILVIALHLIVMTLAYTSPFWLDYRLMLIGILIYYLQIWVFGGCVLTFAQFGRWDETFTGRGIMFLGSLIGIRLRKEPVKKFLDVLPAIFVIIALTYQVILEMDVLVKIW